MIDPYSHEHRLCQCKYPDEGEYTVTVKVRQIESEAESIYSIPVLVTKDTNTVTTEIILGQDDKDYALTGTQEDIFNFIVRFPVDGSIYGNFYCCEFQIDEASWSKSTFNQIYPPYCSFQCQCSPGNHIIKVSVITLDNYSIPTMYLYQIPIWIQD
jgi:hypothetical protein